MLRNGAPAPDFSLPDTEGRHCSLTSLRGEIPLLLIFFRGAFCPTARRDLMRFANVYDRIKSVGADMVAISTESIENGCRLKEQLELPLCLLSDSDFAISERYGVYRSDDTEGTQPHGEPALFILDIEGKIAYSQIQTGPKGQADPAEIALIFLYMSQNAGRY